MYVPYLFYLVKPIISLICAQPVKLPPELRYALSAAFPIAAIAPLADGMSADNLNWLSQWYLSQCDSDWEHSLGVKIDTLDNSGWTLKNLTDTPLQGLPFERVTT